MDSDNVTFWNNIYDSGNMAWGNTVSTFLEEVEPMLSKGCKILDLGCGNGRNSASLDSKGFDVTGLEFSQSNKQKIDVMQNLYKKILLIAITGLQK